MSVLENPAVLVPTTSTYQENTTSVDPMFSVDLLCPDGVPNKTLAPEDFESAPDLPPGYFRADEPDGQISRSQSSMVSPSSGVGGKGVSINRKF